MLSSHLPTFVNGHLQFGGTGLGVNWHCLHFADNQHSIRIKHTPKHTVDSVQPVSFFASDEELAAV